MRLVRFWCLAVTVICLVMNREIPMAQAEEVDSNQATAVDYAKQAASEAFWNGKKAYEQGEFEQAQEHFQKAYLLTNDPDILYDIGQTYRRMGDCGRAYATYQEFLRFAPNSALAALAEKQALHLEVACSAPVREAAPPPASTVASQPSPVTLPMDTAPASPTAAQPKTDSSALLETESHPHRRIWTIVTLASGLVAGGTAAGLGIWNYQRRTLWREREQNLARGPVSGQSNVDWFTQQTQNDRLALSINAVDPVTVCVGLGAAALLATSAVLYVITPGSTPEKNRAATLQGWPIHHTLVADSKSVYAVVGSSF